MPKNRGLAGMACNALDACMPGGRIERTNVRGEDVPYLANQIARAGRPVLAFTGDDLLEEWLASGGSLDTRVSRRAVTWSDPRARYGKPALSFIGPRGAALPTSGAVRIAVCSKYEGLAQRYLRSLERPGLDIATIAVSGSVEAALLHDLADFIIDIVVSGRTIDALDLEVQAVIMTSDLAVLEANR